jgi:hypothetical protein
VSRSSGDIPEGPGSLPNWFGASSTRLAQLRGGGQTCAAIRQPHGRFEPYFTDAPAAAEFSDEGGELEVGPVSMRGEFVVLSCTLPESLQQDDADSRLRFIPKRDERSTSELHRSLRFNEGVA